MRVLPWNGYEGALSLTFDDGDNSQATIALPILETFDKKATFFLSGKRSDYEQVWEKAWMNGHELGNHSLHHKLPLDENEYDAYVEVAESKKFLEEKYHSIVSTYAYPYSFVTEDQIRWLRSTHIGARTGDEKNIILQFQDDVDWYRIPSFVATTDTKIHTYKQIIRQAMEDRAWVVFMIHAIEGTGAGYEPISQDVLRGILDEVSKKNIWVAPFGETCAYWRAQKIVENSVRKNNIGNIIWNVPDFFEKQINLKVELDADEEYQIFQNDKRIVKSTEGVYEIGFSEGILQIVGKKER